jgi:hypothetical protein
MVCCGWLIWSSHAGLYETPLLIKDGAAIFDQFDDTSLQPLRL